jgi:hypothetical protein
MALSACRLAWVSQSPELYRVAQHYQSMALRRVQQEVQQLCTDNSDAILTTLILLSTEVDNRYAIPSSTMKNEDCLTKIPSRQWTVIMKSMLHVRFHGQLCTQVKANIHF